MLQDSINGSRCSSPIKSSFCYGSIYTAAGSLPKVSSALSWKDHCGSIKSRWGVKALSFFDPFGIKEVLDYQWDTKPRPVAFTIKGPYRWARHPLYLFILIMVWSFPNLTTDRLLFNVLWSAWIFTGVVLEERDLVAQFGDAYRDYQQKVPMLFPFKFIEKESP